MTKNDAKNNFAANGSPLSWSENPFELRDKQKELCRRLDQFYKIALSKEGFAPSESFRGALFAMLPMHRRQNPDWMAQTAHSLRDILYPFYKSGAIIKREDAFMRYGSAGHVDQLDKAIGQYFGFLSSVAHHNFNEAAANPIIGGNKRNPVLITEEVFENVAAGFEEVLFEALRRQIDAHKEIDDYIGKKEQDFETLQKLLNLNLDARQYFFSKADELWLDWLWINGFLEPIKEISEDPKRYSYHTPELDYLDRIAPQVPQRVVDIMLTITISPQHFNPEVVDRFLWICQSLPPEHLARIMPKIRDEKWALLMKEFNRWGFEYEKMLTILADAKDYSSLLTLAEAILEVPAKEDISKKKSGIMADNPFYFDNLIETKVFERLLVVDDEHIESALALVARVMGNIVRLGEPDKDGIFDINDAYFLIDVDFFTLEMGNKQSISPQDDMRSLAAAMKKLAQKSIGSRCNNVDAVKYLYETYIKPLPCSQSMWRLKLFIMSLCPDVFKDELKRAFFKMFEGKELLPLIRGAEYEWALKKGFSTLSEEDRTLYVTRVLSVFGAQDEEGWTRSFGRNLLSCVYDGLTDKERESARIVFGKELDPCYEPKARISEIKVGWVRAQAPIDQERLSKMPISEIVHKLKTDWTPEQLRKNDKHQDFLSPLNADGMSNVLKADIGLRFQDYISDATLFFDREHLDSHYTFALLMGVHDVLRNKKYPAGTDWGGLIRLLIEIVNSAKKVEFTHGAREREIGDTWLVSWESVHDAIADILQDLIREHSAEEFSRYRSDLMKVLEYLLLYPDPEPETEFDKIKEIEKDPQTGAERHIGSDPFTAAINSVRGRAFQAFALFVEKERLSISKKTTPMMPPDVRRVYKECLGKEQTQAIMFLFGHYLPLFYYHDREWIHDMVPIIFTADPNKKDLYLAAWEGYLTQYLDQELFNELNDYYRRAIILDPTQYTSRKYFKNLDKGLATHIALAFVHLSDFDFSSDLFMLFWGTDNIDRHKEFISFIGRYCISREKAKEWIESNKIDIEKLKRLWEWSLKQNKEVEELLGFSLWIDAGKAIFDVTWLAKRVRETLERTNGNLEWDHGLTQSLPYLAINAAVDALHILRLHFLASEGVRKRRTWFYLDDKMLEVFRTLYNNSATKDETYKLIDDLLPLDNGRYWKLKDVLKDRLDH